MFYCYRYMVTAFMDDNLHNAIRNQQLSEPVIKLITYQILRGLKYLHSANIIHRVRLILF